MSVRPAPPSRHPIARLIGALAALAAVGLITGTAGAASLAEAWPNYEIFMWQRQSPVAYASLPRLGYSAAVTFGQRGAVDPDAARAATVPLRAAGLRWYVENVATDFYSPYHRWVANQPINKEFLEVQRRYRDNPADPLAFHRKPRLGDPAWHARVGERLAAHARLHLALAAPDRPLFLNLADEPGIADLSAAWDFDLSPDTLADFRTWLRHQYSSLAALNAQWGASFETWEAVEPMSTDAALIRTADNFSAWSDFKGWMDKAFADAIATGRAAVRAVDSRIPVGITGGQAAGWGGWDYGLLAEAIDLIEIYDHGGNRAAAHGLNPKLILLSTSHVATPAEWHRLWRQVLLGTRGTVIWDGKRDVVAPDGAPGQRGRASVTAFTALRGGIPAQILASEPVRGAVGILYSQPSFRLRWLLDRREDWRRSGSRWTDRDAEAEDIEENAWRAALRRAVDALAEAGVTPHWLTPERLAGGVPPELRALILPHSIALSPPEVAAIRSFAAGGGLVLSDASEPGLFDGHGRRLPQPALTGLTLHRPASLLRDRDPESGPAFAALLRAAGAAPPFTVRDAAGGPATDLERRTYATGAVRLLALQPRLADGQPRTAPLPVSLTLDGSWYIRRLGAGPGSERRERFDVALDGVTPTILCLSPTPLPRPSLRGPASFARATTAVFEIGLAGPSPAASQVVRLEVLDAAGQADPARAWVLVLRGAPLTWALPATAIDAPGSWTLRATEILSGEVATIPLVISGR